jgi:hypothetical protein
VISDWVGVALPQVLHGKAVADAARSRPRENDRDVRCVLAGVVFWNQGSAAFSRSVILP